nr:putative protein TPRXL [Penaeus vannamei]
MECHAPLVLAEGIWLLYIEADPQVVWVYVWSWMQRVSGREWVLTIIYCLFFIRVHVPDAAARHVDQGLERERHGQRPGRHGDPRRGGGRGGGQGGRGRRRRRGGGTTHTGWSMKLWRRGSSQERPLRPASSQGSENSYTEEPYVNADAQSAVYAELNSTSGSTPAGSAASGVSYHPYSLNTYSEIPDPLRPLSLAGGLRAYISEGTYENAGYVLSEAGLEQPESSVGSTSTPSSAYYSDVSSSDTQNNKKKKKKRKNEELNNLNLQRSLMPANISASVSMISNHILGGERHGPQALAGPSAWAPARRGAHRGPWRCTPASTTASSSRSPSSSCPSTSPSTTEAWRACCRRCSPT